MPLCTVLSCLLCSSNPPSFFPSPSPCRVLTNHHPEIRLFSPLPSHPCLHDASLWEKENKASLSTEPHALVPTTTAPSPSTALSGLPQSIKPHSLVPAPSTETTLGGLRLNRLASWVAGHAVYGPAVAAAVEPSWSLEGRMRVESVTIHELVRSAIFRLAQSFFFSLAFLILV